jgi:hypothetical protein
MVGGMLSNGQDSVRKYKADSRARATGHDLDLSKSFG